MEKIKLPNRLQIIADKIEKGQIICDVGTDHALLPAYLIQSKKCSYAIACDIVQGPLDKAKDTLIKYELENEVKLIKSNGLEGVKQETFTDIVIAGMGGELISKIISNACFIKNKIYTFYLQPMTKSERLRKYLVCNNFEIIDEIIANDNNKYFEIIIAKYGKVKKWNNEQYVFSEILKLKKDKNTKLFLNKLIAKYERIHKGRPNDKAIDKILKYLKNEDK